MATTVMAIKKVYYPRTQALKLALLQNLSIAFAKGEIAAEVPEFLDQATLSEYSIKTAEKLVNDGENFLPEYPHTDHICIRKHEQYPLKTNQS